MFGRKRREPEPAPITHPWSARLASARSTAETHAPDSAVLRGIDEVHDRLLDAEQDRERLGQALAQLDPAQSGRALKDALRATQERPGSVSDAHLAVLRERFDTVNRLQDRVDELGERIESTVIHVELLAVRTVEATALGGSTDQVDGRLAEPLEQLRVDVAALSAAHDELRTL